MTRRVKGVTRRDSGGLGEVPGASFTAGDSLRWLVGDGGGVEGRRGGDGGGGQLWLVGEECGGDEDGGGDDLRSVHP